jgi:hypothetical protein
VEKPVELTITLPYENTMKLSPTIAIHSSLLLLLSAFVRAEKETTSLRGGLKSENNGADDNYFALTSSEDHELPACISSALGSSNVVAMVRENLFCIKLNYDGLSGREQLISQVHGPAAVGETGPVIFTVHTSTEKTQCFELTKEQKKDLDHELWYFNIHSEMCPNDAVRGQLLPLVSNAGTKVKQLRQKQVVTASAA